MTTTAADSSLLTDTSAGIAFQSFTVQHDTLKVTLKGKTEFMNDVMADIAKYNVALHNSTKGECYVKAY